MGRSNKKAWEDLIKKHSKTKDPFARLKLIDSVADYARNNLQEWESWYDKIVLKPGLTFRFFHSGTMADRKNFFEVVNERIELIAVRKAVIDEIASHQAQILSLGDTVKGLTTQIQKQSETIEALTVRLDLQTKALEDHQVGRKVLLEQKFKEQSEAMASGLESLERKLSEETAERTALLEKLNEETAQRKALEEVLVKETSARESERADLAQKLAEETERREALEREIEELKKQKTVEQTELVGLSDPVPTETEKPKVPDELTPQIEELQHQFEELKKTIDSSNAELTKGIQALSEKVDAMNLEGIRAEVEKLSSFIGIDKAPPAQNTLAFRVATFSAIVLALYDEAIKNPGFKESVSEYRKKLKLE